MLTYDPETIVALATPPGLGALSIVRFSGHDLYSTYQGFCQKEPIDRRAVFSKIYHPQNKRILDEAVIIFFKSPNSFTGEDIIEITCHGGMAVSRSIIMAAVDAGIRNANPGEFSYRAFLNGKIDLLQAEAVASLITSNSQLSTDISLQHLLGRVSAVLSNIKNDAIHILSIIENELDFSEDEIDLLTSDKMHKMAVNIQNKLISILKNSTFGKDILSGVRVVILGRPNTGKSSLFNSILGVDRAIVSSAQGTTRDAIESYVELEGVSVCLVDTAGVWESDKFLDKLGIQKTMDSIDRANLCILVDDVDPAILLKSKFSHHIKDRCVLVRSKCDLDDSNINNSDDGVFSVSSINGHGIDKLLTYISTYIINNVNNVDVLNHVLITHRQRNLLESSVSAIDDIIGQIVRGVETDIIASGLRGFVLILKDVVGEVPNEDILNNIFSNFCVGK